MAFQATIWVWMSMSRCASAFDALVDRIAGMIDISSNGNSNFSPKNGVVLLAGATQPPGTNRMLLTSTPPGWLEKVRLLRCRRISHGV